MSKTSFKGIETAALVRRKWGHGEYLSILLKNKHCYEAILLSRVLDYNKRVVYTKDAKIKNPLQYFFGKCGKISQFP